MRTKTCKYCKRTLPVTEFHERIPGISWRASCKRCASCKRRESRKAIADRAGAANAANAFMPLVFDALNEHGPMRSSTLITLLQERHPGLSVTAQRLFYSRTHWEHAHYITIDKRGTVFVYRIVGDSRPVFAPQSAPKPAPKPKRVSKPADDAEMDAWFESLKAEVAQRQAQREAVRHG